MQCALVLVRLYSNKTASSMMKEAILMYPVHAVLLIIILKFREKFICNGHTLVELLLLKYNEGVGDVDQLEEVESCETGVTVLIHFSLVLVKNAIVLAANGKIKTLHNGV